MTELFSALVGTLVGGFITLLVARYYFKKSTGELERLYGRLNRLTMITLELIARTSGSGASFQESDGSFIVRIPKEPKGETLYIVHSNEDSVTFRLNAKRTIGSGQTPVDPN